MGPSMKASCGKPGTEFASAVTSGLPICIPCCCMPGMQQQGMQMGKPEVTADANSVPGFPQDAFMEGPMMAMDQMVDKPENFGLRPGWSGFMAGMMTFVRVLPEAKYDQ